MDFKQKNVIFAGKFIDFSQKSYILIQRNFKVKTKLQNDENRKEISHIFDTWISAYCHFLTHDCNLDSDELEIKVIPGSRYQKRVILGGYKIVLSR